MFWLSVVKVVKYREKSGDLIERIVRVVFECCSLRLDIQESGLMSRAVESRFVVESTLNIG